MAKALWVLLLAAVVLLIPAWQLGVLSEPVEVCEIDKTTREEHCAVHRAALGTLIRVSAFLAHYGHSIIAVFAVVLAISTIGLWFATRRLQKSLVALQEAGERQIAIAQQSADAATKAAVAAEASVRTMTDTAEGQLRVYTSVQAALIELLEPPKGSLHSVGDQEHWSGSGM